MKGKLFIIFIMVGIPTAAWAFLAWVMMLTLGALHSAFSVIPALSFLKSFLGTLMLFSVVVFGIYMTTEGPPPRRPLTPALEETVRRQKSCLTAAYSVDRFLSDARWGGLRNISFCLSRLGGHFPFHGYFAGKTKSRSSAGFIVSARRRDCR